MNEETKSLFEKIKKNLSDDKEGKIFQKTRIFDMENVFMPIQLILSESIPNNAKLLWVKLHYAGAISGITVRGAVQIAEEMGIYPFDVINLLEILDKEGWLDIKYNKHAEILEYYVLIEEKEKKNMPK